MGTRGERFMRSGSTTIPRIVKTLLILCVLVSGCTLANDLGSLNFPDAQAVDVEYDGQIGDGLTVETDVDVVDPGGTDDPGSQDADHGVDPGSIDSDTDSFSDGDSSSEDTGSLLQPVGGPCSSDDECKAGLFCSREDVDGFCIQPCSASCTGDLCCPDGYYCGELLHVPGIGADVLVCFPDSSVPCRPCDTDGDCGTIDAACLDGGGHGAFCAVPCGPAGECGDGFQCDAPRDDGFCIPAAAECECPEFADFLNASTSCWISSVHGTCTGERHCEASGLTGCSAPEPAQETCDGVDNDCNGATDEDGEAHCDDTTGCTDDFCLLGACVNDVWDGFCSVGGGYCATHGEKKQGDPCQICNTDVADDDWSSSASSCDDGDSCTESDLCKAGVCQGTAFVCDDGKVCTENVCDGEGGCQYPRVDGWCLIADICYEPGAFNPEMACEACNPNQSKDDWTPVTDCDDGDPCTLDDQCVEGICAGIPVQCEDGTDCTSDLCDPDTGSCTFTPNHADCDDGDVCNGVESCETGVGCVEGVGLECDDGNHCTDDDCGPVGCSYQNNTTDCDDDDACTEGDQCVSGLCVAGLLLDCDDGNPCTDDSCDPQGGCLNGFNEDACDDGDVCTHDDICQSGSCVSGPLLECDDGNPCTDDSCDSVQGCLNGNNTEPCNDGNACTVPDLCQDGDCLSGPFLGCDDGNPCTDDGCSPADGCFTVHNDETCDDGSVCTTDDRCSAGACIPGSSLVCDDGDACNGSESCDPQSGCLPGIALQCDDEDVCNGIETCDPDSGCLPGTSLDCGDENSCTDNGCDPVVGCWLKFNTSPCDDADACTSPDLCSDGGCIPGPTFDCNDGNPCTDDACDPVLGCVYANNTLACDDGNACSTGDQCNHGDCLGGAPLVCDDGDVCNGVEACNPAIGCGTGTPPLTCDDHDVCNGLETCDEESGCVPGVILNCNDGDTCTTDSCDPGEGCRNILTAVAMPEVCNGLDDDCDGMTDREDPDLFQDDQQNCENQTGVCSGATKATIQCVGGAWAPCTETSYGIYSVDYQPEPEASCDALDNDCDGATDEGFANTDQDSQADCVDDDDDGDGVLDDGGGNGIPFDQPCTGGDTSGCDDNCSQTPNADQADVNGNGTGDVCEDDWDGDGITNAGDNCPWVWNPDQGDLDNDDLGDACDCDRDADGIGNENPGCPEPVPQDNCPAMFNPEQSNLDGDSTGDVCDNDDDGDGDPDGSDCAPLDPLIHHAAQEACNGVDDDCDSATDEEDASGCSVLYQDADADSYGTDGTGRCLCAPEDGYTASVAGDCDDDDGSVHPTANETCNGKDDDCDGPIDEEGAVGCSSFFLDKDGDDYGLTGLAKCLCAAAGQYSAVQGGDCNDQDVAVHPAAVESCNGKDDDCDGPTDEEDAQGCAVHLRDDDGDTFGVDGDGRCLCEPVAPYGAVQGGDCLDSDPAVNPSVQESCNGKDDDCDGETDEEDAVGCSVLYRDGDDDAFGLDSDARCLCSPTGEHTAITGGDCDDGDGSVNPGAAEACNGTDDDCDGETDEEDASGCSEFFFDDDLDTFGVTAGSRCLCFGIGKYSAVVDGDCDDGSGAVNPGATESCNGMDDDCDGNTDEQDATGCVIYFFDGDTDSYGVTLDSRCLCSVEGLYSTVAGGDCDDGDGTVNPGAIEACNGNDDDCDGHTDEEDAGGCGVHFFDSDNDGWGVTEDSRCICAAGGGYDALMGGDCDDTDQTVHPTAPEFCNSKDDDCDGSTDEENADECTVYYLDSDGDGFGLTGNSRCLCAVSGSYTATAAGDCNDADATVNPGAAESCNGKDDNCDGATDEEDALGCTLYWYDADDDGYGIGVGRCFCTSEGLYRAPMDGDCFDTDPLVNPGMPEICGFVDEDCDGTTDEEDALGCGVFYADVDGDLWGDVNDAHCLCSKVEPYTVTVPGDCDDTLDWVNPDQTADPVDGAFVDQDCDGIDGQKALGTFVSAAFGDDLNDGSEAHPKKTIQAAIDIAADDTHVYVSEGTYSETIDVKKRVSIYGKFTVTEDGGVVTFTERQPDATTTVQNSTLKSFAGFDDTVVTVFADGINEATEIADFRIVSSDPDPGVSRNPAVNTVAVFTKGDSKSLTLARLDIRSGPGGQGQAGIDGADGAAGTDGGAGKDAKTIYNDEVTLPEGTKGIGYCTNDGGKGGKGEVDRTHDGADAESGGGQGGLKGQENEECNPTQPGSNGEAGSTGSSGGHGMVPATALGMVDGNQWFGFSGGSGLLGTRGLGGGGGGSGGGQKNCPEYTHTIGASGGGGGGGGCRGTAGLGGNAGGGAFGIWVHDDGPMITECTIRVFGGGSGGRGGDGGRAGAGGVGGPGGSDGGTQWGSAAGDGGNGAAGGYGGAGAGSAGGVSYGIFMKNTGKVHPVVTSVTYEVEVGGGGGSGGEGVPGNFASNGPQGFSTNQNF